MFDKPTFLDFDLKKAKQNGDIIPNIIPAAENDFYMHAKSRRKTKNLVAAFKLI